MTANNIDMPLISSYTFGSIVIDGESHEDIKIYQGKITPWHYIKHHVFTKDDIMDIIDGTDILVMGIGHNGMVAVEDETKEFLQKKGIQAVIERTTEAVQKYNELVKQGKNVAAILHATC